MLSWGVEKRAVEHLNEVKGFLRREICPKPDALPMLPIEWQGLQGKIWLLGEEGQRSPGEVEIRIEDILVVGIDGRKAFYQPSGIGANTGAFADCQTDVDSDFHRFNDGSSAPQSRRAVCQISLLCRQ